MQNQSELSDEDKKWIDENIGLGYSKRRYEPVSADYETINYDEKNNRKGVKQSTMPKAISYDNYDMPTGDGNFLRLEAGETRIRIVSDGYEIEFHEFKNGNDYSTQLCKGEKCEHCAEGNKKKVKIAYIVLNRKDNKPYIMECKKSVFDQIKSYAVNKEYGDPQKYDLTIIKTGEKLSTKYQVVASPKQSEITEEELQLIGESGISIETTYTDK